MAATVTVVTYAAFENVNEIDRRTTSHKHLDASSDYVHRAAAASTKSTAADRFEWKTHRRPGRKK